MSFIAFEVYLNGERKFTAGANDWQTIFTNVLAQRIDPAVSEMLAQAGEQPSDKSFDVRFSTHISVPGGEEQYVDSGGFSREPTRSGKYPTFHLNSGDVIEIKVVKSDSADAPEWQDPNQAYARVVIASSRSSK